MVSSASSSLPVSHKRHQTLSDVFRVQTSAIPDDTFRGIADKYLGVGDSIFDMLQATAVNSKYFKREKR